MFDFLREYWRMQIQRGLVKCVVKESAKRPEGTVDVRQFFRFTPELEPIIKRSLGPDCLFQWMKDNITQKVEATDFWSYPAETLANRRGDCEDGAILLANLLLQSGIPYYRVLICIYGDHVVVELDGRVMDWTGHGVSVGVPLWYCWNKRSAYTTKEHIQEWKKQS
jgi:hypothetical protein